jgi:hypothetical protein
MIKRICGTRIIPEAYTDRAGHFTFQIGGNPAMAVMDSTSSGIGGINRLRDARSVIRRVRQGRYCHYGY